MGGSLGRERAGGSEGAGGAMLVARYGDSPTAASMSADPLPPLSTAGLETLLAALDPLLDGFGKGESCLDDASAFLARLGCGAATGGGDDGAEPLGEWVERWRQAGGNRQTLRLMVSTLLAERQADGGSGAEGAVPQEQGAAASADD